MKEVNRNYILPNKIIKNFLRFISKLENTRNRAFDHINLKKIEQLYIFQKFCLSIFDQDKKILSII